MTNFSRNIEHRDSVLLTEKENRECIRILGPRCRSLATTVIELYDSPSREFGKEWRKRRTGVLCFVKDNAKRSYFIRLIDLDEASVVFDQEVYNQFRYKTPRSYFHTFEGDESQIGLNFAHEPEAATFKNILERQLRERRERKEHKNAIKRQNATPVFRVPDSTLLHSSKPYSISYGTLKPSYGKVKLTKEDISKPTNFQHISHVGWDPNKGFDLENVEPKLLEFFGRAGVSKKELQDKETREFIYEFLDKHGGIEEALRENEDRDIQTHKIPLNNPPIPPCRTSALSSRPLPPSRIQATPNRSLPKIPVNKGVAPPPPPPPPPPRHSSPPPPELTVRSTSIISSSTTLPPPPPPILNDSRNSLMEDIRRGGSLRHVSREDSQSKKPEELRDGLLNQIRSGITLKKVDTDSSNNSGPLSSTPGDVSSIAGMLQRALAERSTALRFSSSEDEADEEDDDEWDD